MSELKIGTEVHLVDGKTAKVENELGRGGQGIVYSVSLEGKKMALKWYLSEQSDYFYKNLVENAKTGAPSSVFLWPEYVTRKEYGSFGYVMKLRPAGYYEFSSFLLAKHSFESFHAMTVAAMEICEGFKMLHAQGLSYQDLNDGNFFIDPKSGHTLICDNDNVFPHGQNSGIKGKARYMAPEVVAGQNPNAHSDKFSLSVILFMLFFANHPLEGARVSACPCMTEPYEKKFYGNEAIFICDPDNDLNRPVKGVHSNVIKRWPVFPEVLRRAFITEFSRDRLENPTRRLTEMQWQSVIMSVRDCLTICPHCKMESFVEAEKSNKCIICGGPIGDLHTMKIDHRTMVLAEGSQLYIDRDEIPDIAVCKDPSGSSMLVIKNISSTKWSVETPSGRTNIVEPGGIMPVKAGLIISFGSFSKKGTIIK